MHAYIITGGTKEEREKIIAGRIADNHVAPTEIHSIVHEDNSIGISLVREGIRRLHLLPIASQHNVLHVPDAEYLTIEAQNALLKTLEEPPFHTIIFLGLPDISTLLPTIISRCQTIRLSYSASTDDSFFKNLQAPDSTSAGKCIEANSLQNREEALAFAGALEHALFARLRANAATKVLFSSIPIYNALITLRRQLTQNVNTKLATDWFFLSLQKCR